MEMTQEIREPAGIAEMVGQTAEAIALLAVDEVEPGELTAETGFAIVLRGSNHSNETMALDSLRQVRYSEVMSITQLARYAKGAVAPAAAPARRRS